MAKITKEKKLQILKEATKENLIYTDTHFHSLEIEKKEIDIKNLLDQMEKMSFIALDIGINENDIESRYNLLKDYKNIYLSTAIGPWGVKDSTEKHDALIDTLEANIKNYPIKAIGEIGLDNYWKYGTKELQEDLFIKQIHLANKYNLPIIIHNREADEQIINIIKKISFKKNGIIHCFSSNLEFAKIALDKDFYISFAGPITYKNNEELREVLKYVPINKLLIETDSPYLSPTPFRGKTNTPLLIPLIYQEIASIKKIAIEDLCLNVKRNLLTLLDCS